VTRLFFEKGYSRDACTDFDAKYVKRRGSAQGSAFWGSRNQYQRFEPTFSPKPPFFGPIFTGENFSPENGINIGRLESNRPIICTCYKTIRQLSTVKILQLWSCWTYLLRSTRLTTTFCCRGYRQASALAVPVVHDQPYAVCPSWYGPIDHCSADMWCSTGLSAWANFVHHVYS